MTSFLKRGLRFIGLVQSSILLGVFYYGILGVIAVPYRLIKLVKPPKTGTSYWKPRLIDDEASLLNQF